MEQTPQLYLVTREIAEQTGFRRQRYVTKDGRYIVNDRDLRNVSAPYDAESVTQAQATLLISENHYKTGNAADRQK